MLGIDILSKVAGGVRPLFTVVAVAIPWGSAGSVGGFLAGSRVVGLRVLPGPSLRSV